MTYSPPPPRKQAGFLSASLFILSGTSYALSLTVSSYSLPFRLIMMISASVAIYVMVRYLYTGFTYDLRPRNGTGSILSLPPSEIDFCVTRAQGSHRSNLECILSLDKLCRVLDMEDGSADRIRKEYRGIKFYYYTLAVKPTQGMRQALIFDDMGELSCIVVEPNAEMKSFLLTVANGTENQNN